MKFLKTHLRTSSDPEMCLLRRCSIVATRILQWSTGPSQERCSAEVHASPVVYTVHGSQR
jgi:hypothetical protein